MNTDLWTEDDRIDACLMSLVRERDDHDAFAALLARLGPAIDGPLFRYLPAAEVDDGRAEVHLRLWARRRLYREGRGTVRSWAGRGISLHYAFDWLRKHARSPRQLSGPTSPAVADRHPGPAAAAEEADWAAHVARLCAQVLAGLPPHVRTCFTLRLLGVGYADIAAAVGRPARALATAVHRVRKRLLALLNDHDHPCFPREDRPMTNTPKPNGIEALNLSGVLARLAAAEARLDATDARLAGLEDDLAEAGQDAYFVPDEPGALAWDLIDRLRALIADPARHGSDVDWAEVEDLAERLRPVARSLPKGLLTKVSSRLRESRELLKKAPGHGAATAQVRGVVTLLEAVADGGPDAAVARQ